MNPTSTASSATSASLAASTAPALVSKLPEVGTTIFSIMSALAVEKNAVNLGQGFPDFACDPALKEAVSVAMAADQNQYPPMPGVPVLRENIAAKIAAIYGHRYDPATEITVTAGATQGIMTILLACVHAGDEVIVIEPAYDSYVPSIRLAGGIPVFVSMELDQHGYTIPWDKVAAAITGKTRMILLNSPHNPTGFVLGAADVQALADIVRNTRVLIASDEVYEHMVYDGQRHESLSRHPELAQRSFIISSFGKTYHVTGWKVGYVAAPAALMAEFRKVHQFNVFTVNTPMQYGLAHYMANPAPYLELPAFYQRKRDLFRDGLKNSRFRLLPAAGTYFQSVDYTAISDLPELEFAQWLTAEVGVAAIPVSAFYNQPKESGVVRFCFAKQDATLQKAIERLQRI
ncbi:pyridoxal phosphate-dependent aminotransferase [Undibacterium sp.]|uniref:pyridoxal phosphate-dependent aminotransferase n=1 Tax=Undibacterium sp. TaxID=1914977 RepID=UPI00374D5807